MARLGLISVPCLRHCHPCPVVPPPFLGHSPFRRWWRSSLLAMHEIEKRYVFLFPAPQVSAWGPCFRSVDLFPPGWNGVFHLWRYSGGASRSTASTGGFSLIQVPWVPVYLVSWALSLGAIASVMFRLWQLPLPLLFFTPFASLVFLENFGFVGVDGDFGSGF